MYTEPNVKSRSKAKPQPGYLHYKRVQDIALSVLALILLLPVMMIIALVILVDSPGESPIFVQTRVGLNGRQFRFFKFTEK